MDFIPGAAQQQQQPARIDKNGRGREAGARNNNRGRGTVDAFSYLPLSIESIWSLSLTDEAVEEELEAGVRGQDLSEMVRIQLKERARLFRCDGNLWDQEEHPTRNNSCILYIVYFLWLSLSPLSFLLF